MKYKLSILFVLIFYCLQFTQTRIQMEKIGGVYFVPCKVNGVPLKFIFDTGASDVSISLSEAIFMIKNGYILQEDLGEKVYYSIANGDVAQGTKLNIKEIEIEGLKMYNVSASIVHELKAPLLLGQSFIERLGRIQIDKSELLIFDNATNYVAGNSHNSDKSNYGSDFNDLNIPKGKFLNLLNSDLEGNWKIYEVKIYTPNDYKISNIFNLGVTPQCLEGSNWFLNKRYNGNIKLDNNQCNSLVKNIKWEVRNGDFLFKYIVKNNNEGFLLTITNIDSSKFELTQKIPFSDGEIYIIYKFQRI